MSPRERARFEMRMVREPQLAEAVDLHREIESSVRRSFAIPDLTNLIDRVESAAAQVRGGAGAPGRAMDGTGAPGRATDGTVRWIAAAGTFVFMMLAMCVTTVIAPTPETGEGQSITGWRDSLVEAVSLGLATASAVATGVTLRGRRGRSDSVDPRRPDDDVRLPAGARGEGRPVPGVGRTLLALIEDPADPTAAAVAGADPHVHRSTLDGRRFLRRQRVEWEPVALGGRTYAARFARGEAVLPPAACGLAA